MTFIWKKRTLISLTILILSLLIIAGCNSGETASKSPEATSNAVTETEQASPQSGGTIKIGVTEEPDTLDVHKSSMGITSQIASHIGGGLLVINPETNELEPYLAESYSVSADGTILTFKIRQGVAFQDGTLLTAQDFKDTFDRIMNPATGATTAVGFVGGIKSVSAPDAQTFVIELAAPSATILHNVADAAYLQPLSMSAVEASGSDYGRNPMGVGPFKFNSWVTGQSILLSRNDDYNWASSFNGHQGKAYADQLEYKFIPDKQTMLAALDSGSIDIAYNVDARDAQRYRGNEDYYIVEADLQGLGLFIEMNLDNELLQDVNVRKAINMAISKDAIIQAVLSGEGSPAYGPLASTIFGYDPEVENYGYKFNTDEAIQLLESSGWKKNNSGIMEKDGKQLKFELSLMNQDNQAAQMVQAMLKDIGIKLTLQVWDAGTLVEKASQGDYELSFLVYAYEDPDILYLLFHSSQIGVLNHDRVNNPELDQLLEQGRITLDAGQRKQIYAEIQKIIVDEAYWAPIYVPKLIHIVNKKIQNVKMSNSTLLLYDSWVKSN